METKKPKTVNLSEKAKDPKNEKIRKEIEKYNDKKENISYDGRGPDDTANTKKPK